MFTLKQGIQYYYGRSGYRRYIGVYRVYSVTRVNRIYRGIQGIQYYYGKHGYTGYTRVYKVYSISWVNMGTQDK